jgi:hypothetical protein
MKNFFDRLFRRDRKEESNEDDEQELCVSDWLPFLKKYNRELLNTEDVKKSVPFEVIKNEWMGYPGATEEQIRASEDRLSTQFPQSIREFYKITNGWRCAGFYTDAVFPFEILPVEKVEWFRTNNQEWINIYNNAQPYKVEDEKYFVYGKHQNSVNFRAEYLQTALEISTIHDAGVYLLNPQVITIEGEWEAWHFSNWMPGALRFQSFLGLLVEERQTFIKLLQKS